MRSVPLGRTGIDVTRVCLGTMTFGEQNDERESHAILDRAAERGVRFLDAAELYPIPPKAETQGRTEQFIGSWLKASGRRNELVIATKIVGRARQTWYRPDPDLLDGGLVRLTRKQIDYAVEQSLRRLGVETIDLYQLHWPDRAIQLFGGQTYRDYPQDFVPFEEVLESLARHVAAGRIRAIGVSNETPWGLMRFLQAADALGLPRIASIQNAYNLVNRTFEHGLAEIALREDAPLLAYSPLAQGYLTGKYCDGALPPGSRKHLFDRLQRYEGPGAQEAINSYLDLARDLGVAPEALALKFCDTRPFVASTIIGATSVAQLDADLDAFDLVWTEDMDAGVDARHAARPNPCP